MVNIDDRGDSVEVGQRRYGDIGVGIGDDKDENPEYIIGTRCEDINASPNFVVCGAQVSYRGGAFVVQKCGCNRYLCSGVEIDRKPQEVG